MSSVGLGVMLYNRLHKFDQLLESVPTDFVDHVYVTNDGEWTAAKQDIIDSHSHLDVTLIDPDDENVNLGRGRNLIVEEYTEDYLLIADTDHLIPENVHVLRDVLETPRLGAVCGLLVEPEQGAIYTGCRDLFVDGSTYIRDIRTDKQIELQDSHPYVEFDYLSGPILLSRECLSDYSWDPAYRIGYEHGDFFVSHAKTTDWSFALVPEVLFHHYPGGGEEYTSRRRGQDAKFQRDRSRFYEKWGFNGQEKSPFNYVDTVAPRKRSLLSRTKLKVRRLLR